jgi:lipoprotein-anchoring transpeptidase ErfK/SrfK
MSPPLSSFLGNLRSKAALRKRLSALGIVALGALTQAAWAREIVPYATDTAPGTVVIDASRRRLFFVLREGKAVSYPIGVPRHGDEWSGSATVNGKFVRPDWVPPPEVKVEEPFLPDRVKGGAPNNPMGARAITLDRTDIAIHGSTRRMRASIGGAASHGCIRMYNEDVIDLYNRVEVGTPVMMLP